MTRENVLQMVAAQLGRRSVRGDDDLFEGLGAESLDLVNLAAAVEERCGVVLTDEELATVRTPDELHAAIGRHLRTA